MRNQEKTSIVFIPKQGGGGLDRGWAKVGCEGVDPSEFLNIASRFMVFAVHSN